MSISPQTSTTPTAALTAEQSRARYADSLVGRDGEDLRQGMPEGKITFKTVIDAINPLQHIPVVSSIYREITGETIGLGSRLAGGALFGGVLGFLGSAFNAVVEGLTGKDVAGNVFALAKDAVGLGSAAPSARAASAYAKAAQVAHTEDRFARVDSIG